MRFAKQRLITGVMVAAAFLSGACGDVVAPPLQQQASLLGSVDVSTLVLRATPAVAETVVAVIGQDGGEIRAGGHILIVPGGSVAAPTTFTMKVVAGNYIQVDLHATRVSDGAEVTSFPKPVRLKLDYKHAVVVTESRLDVAYLVDGTALGSKQVMSGSVDYNGRYVDALLSHFSLYALIID